MIAKLLHAHKDEVLRAWDQQARHTAAARGLSRPELWNLFSSFLAALGDETYELGSFSGRTRELLGAHISMRLRQGFQLAEVVDEIRVLGECVAAVGARLAEAERPTPGDLERLFRELQLASVFVADQFAAHMREEEQLEKRYRRLIQTAVLAASKPDPSSLRERLDEVLSLVMEAMDAQCAALFLFGVSTERLDLTAATGLAKEAIPDAASALRPSSFVGRVARSEATTEILDAATTPLEVNSVLRRSGIHSLLGVRLPPRHALIGVLYIGVTEVRSFSPREIGRLEMLGEQLTLHLDNARLFKHLIEERELREQTISMVAHDLRGPLAAAKAAAQVLSRTATPAPDRAELATRIERNVDRLDRMLRDLLDARTLDAGERLHITPRACDLGAIARDVLESLRDQFGERFQLSIDGDVRGYWSADELHRSIWNLATNAVKYGDERAPIAIHVSGGRDDVRISVHNEGVPIAVEGRATLFEPFRRSRAAAAGTRGGWGLGLSLVRGCAEAHGGTVDVESSASAGTTFTIRLPRDARKVPSRARETARRESLPSSPP